MAEIHGIKLQEILSNGLRIIRVVKSSQHIDREKLIFSKSYEHLKRLLGRVGKKKKDSQKWRMKQKLVSKGNYVNLVETFSTAFY